MRFTRFEIKNFKGIQHTTVALADEVPGNIITLIGLNESGKTTILEALASFGTEDKDTAMLVASVQARAQIQDYIPKDKKAAFTGRVEVKAYCVIEDSDLTHLKDFFESEYELELGDMKRNITVTRFYEFEDSKFVESKTHWYPLVFPTRKKRAKRFTDITSTSDEKTWLAATLELRARLPKIVYFPTFLFKFPDRIYLEGDSESEVNPYYQTVIQDVLDSQGEGLSVQRHIVDRIKRVRSEYSNPATFLAHLLGLDEKSQVDAVLQKLSNEMSREIFGAWNQILGRNISNKRVQVDWSVDSEKGNVPFLQVSIIDGQSRYALSERSLGFRWFFSFLLFTRFRRNRNDKAPTIFLFDEPAANLHSKAQMKLLESFPLIAAGDTFAIYSTHSHYMVNPEWLEKAYIVDNEGIDYDDENDIDAFAIKKTNVKAVKYRTFVGFHPTKTTYFQPVLDALDVAFSPLLKESKAIIVEGKFDYHPLEFFKRLSGSAGGPQFYPANGASGLGCLISLFRGWGVQLRVLLDDDPAGKRAKADYVKDGLLLPHEIVTIGEVNADLKGRAFEAAYDDDVVEAVKARFGISKPNKRHYSLFFQELLATNEDRKFPKTEKRMAPIMQWSNETLA